MALKEPPRPALGVGKPALRGISHIIAAFAALVSGIWLWKESPTKDAKWGSLVFTCSLVFLFSISGTYHAITWRPESRKWWRRLDHAAIFVQIAGTYTPICLLALPEDLGRRLLIIIWTGASLGILQSLFWVTLPKPLAACLYLGLGWVGYQFRKEILSNTSWQWCGLILGGGLLYSLGALVYVMKKPNPFPKTFGYHEIFHVLVILAAAMHFQAVAQLALHPRARHKAWL